MREPQEIQRFQCDFTEYKVVCNIQSQSFYTQSSNPRTIAIKEEIQSVVCSE
jgi:hypothetical protein